LFPKLVAAWLFHFHNREDSHGALEPIFPQSSVWSVEYERSTETNELPGASDTQPKGGSNGINGGSVLMTETHNAIFGACLTIFGGITIFSLTKIVEGYVLAPLLEQGKAFGEIAGILYFLGEVYANPLLTAAAYFDPVERERYAEAKVRIRKAAGDLIQATGSVKCYRLLSTLRVTPKRETVREIVGLLTGISNNLFTRDGVRDGAMENSQSADKILALMKWPRLSK
jgi:hypothetical protein